MTRLVTLAHRVSNIHHRYSRIHSSVLSFSMGKFLFQLNKRRMAEPMKYREELASLRIELTNVEHLMQGNEPLEPRTTLGIEFAQIMSQYTAALAEAIGQLEKICRHLCRDPEGKAFPYSEQEMREDRIAYDLCIQRYQRYGERLQKLFARL